MVATRIFQSLTIGAAGFGLALTFAAAAQAQSNGGSMNAGFGHSTTSDGNIGVSAGTRDANGNRVIIDGIIQGGLDQSSISSTSFGSFSSLGSGAGAGATAIGNNLSVVTQGSWNTVIVNSTQTNTGTVTATSTTGGAGGNNGN